MRLYRRSCERRNVICRSCGIMQKQFRTHCTVELMVNAIAELLTEADNDTAALLRPVFTPRYVLCIRYVTYTTAIYSSQTCACVRAVRHCVRKVRSTAYGQQDMLSPVRLSVRPSVTWVNRSKTIEVMIMQLSPQTSPMTLVSS